MNKPELAWEIYKFITTFGSIAIAKFAKST